MILFTFLLRWVSKALILLFFFESIISKEEGLFGCCKFLKNYEDLLNCTHDSINRNYETIKDQIPYINGAEGPRSSVILITRMTMNIHEYAAYSLFAQAVYANFNNYALFPVLEKSTEVNGSDDYTYFRKLRPNCISLYPNTLR